MSRRSAADSQALQRKATEIIAKDGLPVVASQQLADTLGVSRQTLHRYLSDLALDTHDPEKITQLKIEIMRRIAAKMDELDVAGTLTPGGAVDWTFGRQRGLGI